MNSMRFLLNLHYRRAFMKSLPSLLWRSVMVGIVVNILTPFFNPAIYASLSFFVDTALFF
uniref:Armadillo repeat kinesin n=1 Tax=Citrus limon TaxID=2708 RepID=A0A1S8ADK3_CITLI